jgi:surface protein
MRLMFSNAESFNQNISTWNVEKVLQYYKYDQFGLNSPVCYNWSENHPKGMTKGIACS